MPTSYIVFIGFIAAIPAILWFLLILKLRKIPFKLIIFTLLGGMAAVAPISLMKYFFVPRPDFNLVILQGNIQIMDFFKVIESSFSSPTISLFAGFILVGIIEEYLKHYVVKRLDSRNNKFQTIADSIGLAGFAALGFAFVENIVYALSASQEFGALRHFENLGFFEFLIQPETLMVLGIVLLRSIISTCAHIFFASIYGYYYGIHLFAREEMVEEMGQGHRFVISHFIEKITRIPISNIFAGEKLLEGLFLAMLAHAIYNFLMSTGFAAFATLFVIIGFVWISYELQQKRNLVNYRNIEREIHMAQEMHDLHDKKSKNS